MTNRVYQTASVITHIGLHSEAARVAVDDSGVYVTVEGDDTATYTYAEAAVIEIRMQMAKADCPLSRANAATIRWHTDGGSVQRETVDNALVLDDGWLRIIRETSDGWVLADSPPMAYDRIRWNPNE